MTNRGFVLVVVLVLDWVVFLRGRGRVGSWSQGTVVSLRRLSMDRTNCNSTRGSKAAEHRRNPRRWRVG